MQTFAQAGKGGPLCSGANTKSARGMWALLWSEAEQKIKVKVNVFVFGPANGIPAMSRHKTQKEIKVNVFVFGPVNGIPAMNRHKTQKEITHKKNMSRVYKLRP
jgi:hypothetical protein